MLIEYAMIGFRSRQKNRTVAFLRQPAALAQGGLKPATPGFLLARRRGHHRNAFDAFRRRSVSGHASRYYLRRRLHSGRYASTDYPHRRELVRGSTD